MLPCRLVGTSGSVSSALSRREPLLTRSEGGRVVAPLPLRLPRPSSAIRGALLLHLGGLDPGSSGPARGRRSGGAIAHLSTSGDPGGAL